jgi:amino acid transporter
MSEAPSPAAKGGELGRRRLGTPAAVAQALAIGPMFSTAIVLSFVSNPVNGAAWNTPLAVLIAGLGVLAIAYSISLFAKKYHGAGAIYEYLTRGAHPAVGIFAAGVFFTGTLFLGGGGIYLGLGILTQSFWQEHISTSTVPAWWLILLLFLALVLILNYVGVRVAIGAMLTFAALSFTPMLILALTIIAKGGADGNTLSGFNPSTTSLHVVFNGVMLGILLFVGFEAAASIGEESHDPHRSIPRALLGTVGASAVFFVLMAYAISIGLGKAAVDKGGWAFNPAALDQVATQYIGSWFATIIDLIVILDATALALAICVTIGRGYFALGRDGLLPSFFAKT